MFSSLTNRYIDVDFSATIDEGLDLDDAIQSEPPLTLAEMRKNLTLQVITDPTPITCNEIVDWLVAKCVAEPTVIDIRERSFMADYLIICSAPSNKALRSLALELKSAFAGRPVRTIAEAEESLQSAPKICGIDTPDWICLDFGTIIVHLMLPDARATYAIERIWTGQEDAAVFEVAEEQSALLNDSENSSENVSL